MNVSISRIKPQRVMPNRHERLASLYRKRPRNGFSSRRNLVADVGMFIGFVSHAVVIDVARESLFNLNAEQVIP